MLCGLPTAAKGGKMKHYRVSLTICAISFILLSCVTTKISSFTDPNTHLSDYKTILVLGNLSDIELRKTLESDLVQEFAAKGIKAISYVNIISPLRNYSEDDLSQIYLENGIDAILSVALIDTTEQTMIIPQQTHVNYRSQYIDGQFISVPYTTTTGGYSVSSMNASFEIIIIDTKTRELVLRATANTEGDEFYNMKLISKSLSKKIVEEFLTQS